MTDDKSQPLHPHPPAFSTCGCSQGQSLHHMPNSLNASISDYWDPKTTGIFCNLVHRCTLRPSTCHYWETWVNTVFDVAWCIFIVKSLNQAFFALVLFSLITSFAKQSFTDFHFYLKVEVVHSTAHFITPSWVIQIEPQPMPTLRASTPASMRFLAWAAVTTRERQRHRKGWTC